MNGKTGGKRGPWRAAALAVAAAVAVLTTACGVVHVHFGSSGGSAPTGPAAYRAELAYAQCMRAHGLPGFPDPGPSGGPSFHQQRRPPGSAQLNGNPNSPAARANDACKHLLPGGSTGTDGATAPSSNPHDRVESVHKPACRINLRSKLQRREIWDCLEAREIWDCLEARAPKIGAG